MSKEDDDESYSDYSDDSFDNESIEEVSENESACSTLSTEDILPQVADAKSSTSSLDKPSPEEDENDLSSLNADDNAISQLLQNTVEPRSQCRENANEHEIDESDTDNEDDSEIIDNMQSLIMDSKKENKSDSSSIPVIIEPTPEKCHNEGADSCVTVTDQQHIEFDIRSDTPTSFNSDDHAFHVDILKEQERYIASKRQIEKKSRNSNRKSLSFSNERMREIERHNQILLRKILTQKPRKEAYSTPSPRTSTSAVNRKKQQRQIDMDNQVLKKKLEAIAGRRRNAFQ